MSTKFQELHALTVAMGLRECIHASARNGRFELDEIRPAVAKVGGALRVLAGCVPKPRGEHELREYFALVNGAVGIVHSEDGVNFLRFITAVESLVHDTWRSVTNARRKRAWRALLDALAALHEAYDPDLEVCAEVNAGLAMGEKLLEVAA